ncbi:uracil phosphoribosyltransferase [Candidatus Mycoplasma haematolamae str. Purdue]|uniref:Uracil phosphoribosyltransferase n=1 Tax=Mycoplasma haematolamae (strain Purdue) TaxID=1212765 RepID=I7CH48_MYCHA|nr:uracil phosphoribosyltransferase [Candidatus Mycoplasma haematolamae str. Purdue]
MGKARDVNSNCELFSSCFRKISILIASEAAEEFKVEEKTINTPLMECTVKTIAKPITVIPVLRSGLIMADAMRFLFEDCTIAHLGLYRDDSLNAVKYYEKFPPELANTKILLCDPLIATAATVMKSLDIIYNEHKFTDVTLLGILISRQAADLLSQKYPNLNIYVADMDEKLNDYGYILPGVGDAGNRLFGTA